MPSQAWGHVPLPAPGDWITALPPAASFGEVTVYARAATVAPGPFSGKMLRIQQLVTTPSFYWLVTDPLPGAGPAGTINAMDCRLLVRLANPAGRVYLMSVDEQSNLMWWLYTDAGSFHLSYVTTWSPYTQVDQTVTIPSGITATAWIWLRLRLTSGVLVLEFSPNHTSPNPSSWTALGSWTVPNIPVRPSFGDGIPWSAGIQLGTAANATALHDVRRIWYSFNGSAAAISIFETAPTVVGDAITADSGPNYIKHTNNSITIRTE